MARTDSEKTPAMRLNDLRREWGLKSSDEATSQAQNKALGPLTKWLRSGTESPEVIIRAVQVLLADPELPDVNGRPAVEAVIHQVSEIWANAGLEVQGMLGLQAMLLAAWPYELTDNGFTLPPLFNSAWEVMRGRLRQRPQLNAWRQRLPALAGTRGRANDIELDVPNLSVESTRIELPEPDADLEHLRKIRRQGYSFDGFGHQLVSILESYRNGLTSLAQRTDSALGTFSEAITHLVNQLEPVLNEPQGQSQAMQDLLWWGQSRYSQAARRPYRRIENTTERLWWMAWEASDLALGLDVEPAASFLVETIYQLDGRPDEQKRPLKDWLGELVTTLRKLHQSEQHAETLVMSGTLQELAEEDALGLPVTWARLNAENPKEQDSDLEERAREELAIDLDAPISRGDWATWIFLESLLDRRLRDDEQKEE